MGLQKRTLKVSSKDLSSECPVCFNDFAQGDEVVTLSCQHTFHASCIDKYLKNWPRCPCCKEKQAYFPQKTLIQGLPAMVRKNLSQVASNVLKKHGEIVFGQAPEDYRFDLPKRKFIPWQEVKRFVTNNEGETVATDETLYWYQGECSEEKGKLDGRAI